MINSVNSVSCYQLESIHQLQSVSEEHSYVCLLLPAMLAGLVANGYRCDAAEDCNYCFGI